MKYIIPALLLSCLASAAFAQTQPKETRINIPVSCYDSNEAIKGLTQQYKEILIFVGVDDVNVTGEVRSFLTFNSETNTYTFGIHLQSSKMVCILSSGEGSTLNLQRLNKQGTQL